MKIGVITIENVNNYGAELQATATIKVLQDMGYDAEIINYCYYKNWNFKDTQMSAPFVSMSAKGSAYDNAVVESFFGTLKCETIYLQKVKSLQDLIKTIDEYIYWYNNERIKIKLNGLSPIQYRLQAA